MLALGFPPSPPLEGPNHQQVFVLSILLPFMRTFKLLSRVCLVIATSIFVLYLLERFSASTRIPIDVFSVPDTVMFPLLLVMAFFVGASFMIESYLARG